MVKNKQRGVGNIKKAIDFVDRYMFIIFPSAAVAIIVGLMVYPLFYSLYLSFHKWQLGALQGPVFVGFSNFKKLIFSDEQFINSLLVTFYYSGLCLSIEMPLGMGMALILNKVLKGMKVMRVIFLLPILVTPVAISLIWVLMFNPTLGILNYFLRCLKLSPAIWIYGLSTVIPSLVMVDIWKWTPFVMLILLGGLKSLPVSPYEAALIDGASPWQTFSYVTLPLMRPTIMAALLLRLVDSLKTFAVIYTMTGGGPANASKTTYLFAYDTSFKYFRMGYGSAAIMIFFAVLLVISFILIRARRKT